MTTENHNYREMVRGQLNWEQDFNENAQLQDTKSWIRDTRENITGADSPYVPKIGAIALATDTGEVFVPDGSSWNYFGTIGPGGSASSETAFVATPGSVQDTIDRVASSGRPGSVVLERGSTFEKTSAWDVKDQVTLDATGADILVTSDHDVFYLRHGAQILRPKVDFADGFTFTGSVFRFDSAIAGGKYGPVNGTCAGVFGGHSTLGRQEGTCALFRAGSDGAMWGNRVIGHDTDGFDTVCDMFSGPDSNDSNWLNSNEFHSGYHARHNVGIRMRGYREMLMNQLGGAFQTSYGTDSHLVWDGGAGGEVNGTVFDGTLWDCFNCNQDPIVLGTKAHNNLIITRTSFRSTFPDSYPFTDEGPGNVVIDVDGYRESFGAQALNPSGTN